MQVWVVITGWVVENCCDDVEGVDVEAVVDIVDVVATVVDVDVDDAGAINIRLTFK